jgi:hypothetical protein
MSFISKIVKKSTYDSPHEEVPDVHRRFVKYSRGAFVGPGTKIKITKPKITIKSSFDYDDAMLTTALKIADIDTIDATGAIISGDDFTEIMDKYDLLPNNQVIASKGQTKNYKIELKQATEINKDNLIKATSELFNIAYVLLSFASKDKSISLKSKAKPPTPSKKDPDEDDPDKRLNFATLTVPNTPENLKIIQEIFIPEGSVKISNPKEITIENNYEIEDLEMPKNEKDSKMIRVKTKRKGKLKRLITVDGKEHVFEYQMVV